MTWPAMRWVAGYTRHGSNMIHLVEGDTRRMNTHARSIIDIRVADINTPRHVVAYELVPVEAMDQIRCHFAQIACGDLALISRSGQPVTLEHLPDEVKP